MHVKLLIYTAPLRHLHLRSGLYRRACACAWSLFHVLAFDSCWIHIKPTSKRSDSPLIGVVAAVGSRFEFPNTVVDTVLPAAQPKSHCRSSR